MKSIVIEKMNEDKEIEQAILIMLKPYMNEELAYAKANEIMRITGHSFMRMSADERCPYCNTFKDENGKCLC